jgi:hypothetical protein
LGARFNTSSATPPADPAGSFEEVQSRIDCPVADGGARRMSLA